MGFLHANENFLFESEVQENNERDSSIDVAKGIGVILVICGHLLTYRARIDSYVFSFHIPLFFVLGGMTFRTYDLKKNTFFSKKINSIITPFFHYLLLGFLVSMLVPSWRSQLNIDGILQNFYFGDPEYFHVGQLWFLICYFEVEIVAFFIERLIEKKKLLSCEWGKLYILIFLFLIAININNWTQALPGNRLPLKLDSMFMALVFFEIGNWGRLFLKKIQSYVFLIIPLIVLLFSEYDYNGWVNLSVAQYNNPILYIIYALAGTILVVILSKLFSRLRILQFIGKNSLSIFAIHSMGIYLFCYRASNILGYRLINGANIPGLWVVLGTGYVLLFSLAYVSLKNGVNKLYGR